MPITKLRLPSEILGEKLAKEDEIEDNEIQISEEDLWTPRVSKGELTVFATPVTENEEENVSAYHVSDLQWMNGLERRIISSKASVEIARKKMGMLGIKIQRSVKLAFQRGCFEKDYDIRHLDQKICRRKNEIAALRTLKTIVVSKELERILCASMEKPCAVKIMPW